jgi:hypothetical protein
MHPERVEAVSWWDMVNEWLLKIKRNSEKKASGCVDGGSEWRENEQ